MFNKRLKELREEKGLTQKKLALILGCHQSMITRWEKGECEPTESIIRKTAIYFNVTSDYLIGLEDDFDTNNNKNISRNSFNEI